MQRVMQSLFEEYIACRADEELEEEHFLMLQIEKAHWKYDQLSETNTNLRKIKMLKSFVPLFIEKNILDSEIKARIDKKCQAFLQHQITRERAGVILVDKNNTHCVLVENYHLPGCWSFPKGAIENKESPLECAIRECREETGYDCKNAIQHSTAIVKEIKKKYKLTLYIIQGIDMTKHILRPTVKREIKSIKWFEISKMPETIGKQLVYGKTFPTDQKFGILYYFAKDLKNLNNANKEN
uniref:Nudix hydrolase domain-containing protein n=1 Tax=Rhabditophanes sp. KR3021 TaxID=114890 RepID=A0AC35U945_9BILA